MKKKIGLLLFLSFLFLGLAQAGTLTVVGVGAYLDSFPPPANAFYFPKSSPDIYRVDDLVTVTFSEAVPQANMTGITVSASGGGSVASEIYAMPNGTQAVLGFTKQNGTIYTITVPPGIVSSSGDMLTQGSTFVAYTPAAAIPPSGLSYPASPLTLNTNQQMVAATPSLSNVGVPAVTSYSISPVPALPAGVTFTSTGTSAGSFSGTPTTNQAQQTYTVTAYNAWGSTSAQVAISVVTPDHLVFSSQPSESVVLGSAFANQPVVVAQTSANSVDQSFTGTISLAAFSDSLCTVPTAGTLQNSSAQAVLGSASFSGVQFNQTGVVYLQATSGRLYSACSARAVVTPFLANGQYYIGGMDGEVCVPKSGAINYDTSTSATTMYWLPTEDLCIVASPGGGRGTFSISPSANWAGVPANSGNGDTLEVRIQKLSGTQYEVTASNNDNHGFGGPITFLMNTYTASQLQSLQAAPAAPNHPMLYGAFARSGPATFGIYTFSTNGSIVNYNPDPYKTNNLISAGVQIARIGYTNYNDDFSYITPGTGYNGPQYNFAFDDPAVEWLLSNHIIPYINLSAGWVWSGSWTSPGTTNLYKDPTDFANWCSAVANHIKNTPGLSAIGTSVPAYFSIPANEPNAGGSNWDASRSNNPTLYAETSEGPALYMQSCYSAIKQVFPNSKVYAGELSMEIPPSGGAPSPTGTDIVSEITRWYNYGCKVGTCFDGFALHISPLGDPMQPFSQCYYNDNGWSFQCIAAAQAVSTSHGDPSPHVLITETEISSVTNTNYSAGDYAGQSWWVAQDLAAAGLNPSIDGIFYGNIDEDSMYVGTIFANAGLIDTSAGYGYNQTGWDNQVPRPSFYTYCNFAKYPATCPNPEPEP